MQLRIFDQDINVNKENFYKIRFLLEYELSKVRKKIKGLVKKGIITNERKIAKPKNPKYRELVKELLKNRSSLSRTLELMKYQKNI